MRTVGIRSIRRGPEMNRLGSRGLLVCTVIVSLVVALPATAVAGVKFSRVASIPGTGGQVYSFVRTTDGILHLIYPTTVSPQQGITAQTISPSGAIGSTTTALSTDWGAAFPGSSRSRMDRSRRSSAQFSTTTPLCGGSRPVTVENVDGPVGRASQLGTRGAGVQLADHRPAVRDDAGPDRSRAGRTGDPERPGAHGDRRRADHVLG